MKKFTTVAVIAALALATQVFAMGGSNAKGGQSMTTAMSKTTMNTGTKMTTGTPSMTAKMSGAGTMNTTMLATGMTKVPMTPASPMQPVTAK